MRDPFSVLVLGEGEGYAFANAGQIFSDTLSLDLRLFFLGFPQDLGIGSLHAITHRCY